MYIKRLAIVVFTAFVGSTSIAQDSLTGVLTLRDALDATIETHPSLRSFPLRNDALLGDREIADLRPVFTIGAELEDALGTGEIRDFEVVRRFIDVATTQEQVELQSQYTAFAEQTVDTIQPLVTAGQAPQLELDRANSALLRAQLAEQAAAARLQSARIRLANMWANNSPQYGSVDANFLSVGQAGSIESLLSGMSENPDIAYFAAESRLLEARLQLAQTRQQGDITWSAGIRHLKEFDDTGLAFGVTIPLFNKSRASGAMRTARANLQEVEARRLASLNAIEGEIRSLHQSLQQAILEVNTLQQQVIPVLQDVQQQTQAAYAVGNYSYVELISAQQEFLDAQLSLISSAGNAHKIRAEIERLSGIPLSGQ